MTPPPDFDQVESLTRVPAGGPARLKERPTRDESLFPTKDAAKASLKQDADAIDALQDRLYAEHRQSLLVIVQGMDTSGKDGVVRSVFKETSPLGVSVTSFKQPSREELAHDFLWRIHKAAPRRGHIGVFNRSHYEDVLIVRVRELATAAEIESRYEQINAFERHLAANGTHVLKLMLHLSQSEQAERLRERLTETRKRWKFNPSDIEERKLWPDYLDAYELALTRCATDIAPWHVVPADSRSRRNAIAARLIRARLERICPEFPDPGYRLSDYPELDP